MTLFFKLHSQENIVNNGYFKEYSSLKSHYVKTNKLISDSFFLKKYNSLAVNIENWGLGVYTLDSNYINRESVNNIFLKIQIFRRVSYSDFMYHYYNAVGTLCRELIKGKEYKVELYAKPKSQYFSNKIEILITDSVYPKLLNNDFTIKTKQKIHIEKVKPTYSYNNLFNITDSFTKISFIYKAKGKEKYIIIGNITSEKPNILVKNNNPLIKDKGVGIIINNIGITPLDTNEIICTNLKSNSIENKNSFDTILVHQEYFDINKDTTSYNDKKILDLIVKEKLKMILVIGFTDQIASTEYNVNLAKRRAENYKSFLINNNIKCEINTISKGELHNDNNNYNRRIDIYI